MNIEAAGAVVWRIGGSEQIEIAVIHRPRYDDWSLPKGKLENGETHLSCAYREVLEETGHACIFGPELGETVYHIDGIPKVVRYWSAQASDEQIQNPDPLEVDAVEWLPIDSARARLSSRDDRVIVDSFAEIGVGTTPLILLRHATAVALHDWDGDEADRPLDNVGQRQAATLVQNFLPILISEIHTSDALRCIQTVEPLAQNLKIKATIAVELSEYKNREVGALAEEYAQRIFESGKRALICSHAPILPRILKRLSGQAIFKEFTSNLHPADAWILHHRKNQIVAIDEIRIAGSISG